MAKSKLRRHMLAICEDVGYVKSEITFKEPRDSDYIQVRFAYWQQLEPEQWETLLENFPNNRIEMTDYHDDDTGWNYSYLIFI